MSQNLEKVMHIQYIFKSGRDVYLGYVRTF